MRSGARTPRPCESGVLIEPSALPGLAKSSKDSFYRCSSRQSIYRLLDPKTVEAICGRGRVVGPRYRSPISGRAAQEIPGGVVERILVFEQIIVPIFGGDEKEVAGAGAHNLQSRPGR